MRASAATFFSPRTRDLVETAIDTDEIIINCYRLADRYHQNPEVFIDMPLSRISEHIHYTIKLIELQEKARTRRDDD